jgi:hypothetical protein
MTRAYGDASGFAPSSSHLLMLSLEESAYISSLAHRPIVCLMKRRILL